MTKFSDRTMILKRILLKITNMKEVLYQRKKLKAVLLRKVHTDFLKSLLRLLVSTEKRSVNIRCNLAFNMYLKILLQDATIRNRF